MSILLYSQGGIVQRYLASHSGVRVHKSGLWNRSYRRKERLSSPYRGRQLAPRFCMFHTVHRSSFSRVKVYPGEVKPTYQRSSNIPVFWNRSYACSNSSVLVSQQAGIRCLPSKSFESYTSSLKASVDLMHVSLPVGYVDYCGRSKAR